MYTGTAVLIRKTEDVGYVFNLQKGAMVKTHLVEGVHLERKEGRDYFSIQMSLLYPEGNPKVTYLVV